MTDYSKLDAWVDAHFDEEVRFLQELVRVPTDTPPGNNAPHAERTAELLRAFGMQAEAHPVPEQEVRDYGLQSITNLIVRREYGPGRRVALNAHGDVVPPGEGWRHDPYGAQIEDGNLYGRAAAVSKSDFASFTFAVRALEAVAAPRHGAVELHFTYDEEFGGLLGPGWLLRQGPDQARPADRGRLQLRRGVGAQRLPADGSHRARRNGARGRARDRRGRAAGRGPGPERAVRAECALSRGPLAGAGHHPPLPECRPHRRRHQHQRGARQGQLQAGPPHDPRGKRRRGGSRHPPRHRRRRRDLPGIRVEIKRLLLANAMRPLPGNKPLVDAIQRHGREIFGEDIPALGTPLYTDVRLYAEAGIPGVIYGAGPRTVLESHAKRNDERVALEDLRRATKVIARALADLLQPQ